MLKDNALYPKNNKISKILTKLQSGNRELGYIVLTYYHQSLRYRVKGLIKK